MILERFFPDLYIQSIYDLPLAELKEMGIRGLVFDIDNTVAPFDVADPDEKLIDFFAQMQDMGFRLCILSNNNKERVHRFNKPLKALAIHKAGKPNPRKMKQALKRLGLVPQESGYGRRSGIYGYVVRSQRRSVLHHDSAHLRP